MTIIGAGANATTIDANSIDRIFETLRDTELTIAGVTLTGGSVSGQGNGGAIFNANGAKLTVLDSIIVNNQVATSGGGIHADGEVTIINTEISGNTANGNGGGIYTAGGTVSVSGSTISGNHSTVGDGGGVQIGVGATMTVTDSTITGNVAGRGGGFISTGNSRLTINTSTLSGNMAKRSGGAIFNNDGSYLEVHNSHLELNSAESATRGGGGIFNGLSSTTILVGSVLTKNTALHGGAIYNINTSSIVSAADTSIIENTASGTGGGVHNNFGSLTFERSSFSGNVANSVGRGGGGAYNTNGGTMKFNHTTFSGNRARVGGAIENNDFGSLTLIHATITNNSATFRGGGVYNETTNAGTTFPKNTIIAGNTSDGSNQDIYGTEFTSFGNNLIGIKGSQSTFGFTNGVNNDIVGSPDDPVDPRLGPLQDNFGPTLTHALLPDSPAIDAGNIGGTTPSTFGLTFEQRGLARVIDGDLDGRITADIGAFEFGAAIDFGDAPDGFPTLLGQDGARHRITSLVLGATIDAEFDGRSSVNADGDDTNDLDDEDGVTFVTELTPGQNAMVEVVASATGVLNAWIDFTGDGDWLDDGEQIFTDEPLSSGANTLSFLVPASSVHDSGAAARFRLDRMGGLAPTGFAANGEVEDYLVAINVPPASSGNAPPVARPDTYSTQRGTQLAVNAANGVLDNDTDSDGDALTSELLLPPSSGQITLNTDGSFSYSPDPGFVGTDRFIYKVDDGKGGTDVALATINVNQNHLTIQATSGDGASEMVLRQNGDQLEIVIGDDTATVALDQFGLIVIQGVDGEPDLVTIDFAAGGFFTIPSGIEVFGGSGDGDTLTVIGVAGTKAELTPGAIGDGLLTFERNGESIDVRFNDVESTGVTLIDDLTINGNLNVGDRTVTFDTLGFTKLGPRTTIDGGTLIAGGLALGPGDVLIGNGTVDARIAADVGSTIDADGDLTLGDVNAFDGFFSDGVLQTNDHTVTILDRDLGVLGALTEMGNAIGSGVLTSQNGLLLENGKTLAGYGVINGDFENQGHVVGAGPNSSDELVFTGNVSGTGRYDGNVRFTGAFGAGEGPAEAEFGGDATFDATSTLQIQIGGPAAGEFDRLTIAGDLRLGGALEASLVDLGDGYQPKLGDRFEVMTFASSEGAFIDVTGTQINERFRLDPVLEQGRLDLVVVHATWHNIDTSQDVNVDGTVTPNDVLRIINELNRSSPRSLPLPTVNLSPPPFYDVNGDQALSPQGNRIRCVRNNCCMVISFVKRAEDLLAVLRNDFGPLAAPNTRKVCNAGNATGNFFNV